MYKLKLPNFEGPFDLLLYFIKRDELNIYDIPISKITEEFLKYVRIMQHFDLELAGEFLVMAATLMYIKAQMLLPQEESDDGTPAEDPRNQLVQKLLEYKRYKDAAFNLKELEDEQRYVYYRRLFIEDYKNAKEAQANNYTNANIFDLIRAMDKVLSKRQDTEEEKHIVNLFSMTVEEKSRDLIKSLQKKQRIFFSKYIEDMNKASIIVTFLAILDLIRNKTINIIQDNSFDEIIISLTENTDVELA